MIDEATIRCRGLDFVAMERRAAALVLPWFPYRQRADLPELKRELHAKGYSYRAAAQKLGIAYQHLSDVLNGKRHSQRLIAAIRALPINHQPNHQESK